MMSRRLDRYPTDPVAFIDDCLPLNERGERWRLEPHQRAFLHAAFTFDAAGCVGSDTILYSCPKKSGKTTLNAAVTCWWAFTQEAPNELLIIANDFEQAQDRVFKTLVGLIKHNPTLARSAVITAKQIVLSNSTTITVLASEYAGAAGSNHGFTSWDELWGYTSEPSRRLWEELTPVPTRRNSLRFITTYAGWEGESDLLWGLYKLGVSPDEHSDGRGERLDPDLPLFANREARLLAYWDHEPRMPWQTPTYYRSQRRVLRPSTYLRLHENRWTTTETTFLTPELWDPNVDAAHHPLGPNPYLVVHIGVDAGIKHDNAGIVVVARDRGRFVLVWHRLYKPTPAAPLDLEATVEAELLALAAQFAVQAIYVDPYQMHRSITTLQQAGLPVREFPQTPSNTTRMGQVLYDLLKSRSLVLYPDDELRQQALHTVAVETPRGFRLAKEKSSHKIDAIIALAMAAIAAIDTNADAQAAVLAAAMDPAQIELEFDQIRRAMPNVDWQLMSDDTLS